MTDNAAQFLPDDLKDQPNATVLQGLAARPDQSVWVRASAGSGKTRVLVNRLLRLLLPSPDGKRAASPPSKILCLTFTKAGAAEMALRVQKELTDWVVLPDDALRVKLGQLLEEPDIQPDILRYARQLFAEILEAPEGLKIMTIHSFCQSVLGRFPIEAGLPPHFALVDDMDAKAMLQSALHSVLTALGSNEDHVFYSVFQDLLGVQTLPDLTQSIQTVLNEPLQLQRFMQIAEGRMDLARAHIRKSMGLQADLTADDVLQAACDDSAFPAAELRSIAATLAADKGMRKRDIGTTMQAWLGKHVPDRMQSLQDYARAYYTQNGTLKDTLQKYAEAEPDTGAALMLEAARVERTLDQISMLQQTDYTAGLLVLASAVQNYYTAEKLQRGVLDYTDLILRTLSLLKNAVSWVHYKLDEGLHHILVDEAQDTNPEQWEIIQLLSEEFFTGANARSDLSRSVFVVGDEKQSIYSFQRADLASFEKMRLHFRDRITAAKMTFEEIPLPVSFRTTPPVLMLTDRVFENPADRIALGITADKPLRHYSHRANQPGHLELWPMLMKEDSAEAKGWELPLVTGDSAPAIARCATQVANTIGFWLQSGRVLPSQNRAVEPGDILILVQRRNALVGHLIKELKQRNIPVSGVDRMVLQDQLAVQDLLAMIQFVLMPTDDFTLACVLKCPLIGLSDDDVMDLALGRGQNTLYAHLKTLPQFSHITTYLDQQLRQAHGTEDDTSDDAFAFLQQLLSRPCPALPDGSGLKAIVKRLGPDMIDPIEELLEQAIQAYGDGKHFGLQAFHQMQAASSLEIKREMENSRNQIRIMTVHASKGLEAPIVILPDTTSYPDKSKRPRLYWPQQASNRTRLDAPLWSPAASVTSRLFKTVRDEAEILQLQEYRRLLYVALTRARDELYVTGYQGGKAVKDDCWYNLIKAGFERLPDVQTDDRGCMIYTSAGQITSSAIRSAHTPAALQPIMLPGWINQTAPAEPDPVHPLQPSRPSTPDRMNSPLQVISGGKAIKADQHRFRRGLVTHTLFEVLPDLAPDRWDQTARYYVDKNARDLDETVRADIVRDVLNVLKDPGFAPVFGPLSRGEVPVTGMIDDPVTGEKKLISGQIDRIVILENRILIVDFKTNRPSPKDPRDIPAVYREQLRLYALTLTRIYPNRLISCALLWTDQALLMPVEITL